MACRLLRGACGLHDQRGEARLEVLPFYNERCLSHNHLAGLSFLFTPTQRREPSKIYGPVVFACFWTFLLLESLENFGLWSRAKIRDGSTKLSWMK